ncbi:hypothetical protein ACJX0J_025179, partial [Zea mays]
GANARDHKLGWNYGSQFHPWIYDPQPLTQEYSRGAFIGAQGCGLCQHNEMTAFTCHHIYIVKPNRVCLFFFSLFPFRTSIPILIFLDNMEGYLSKNITYLLYENIYFVERSISYGKYFQAFGNFVRRLFVPYMLDFHMFLCRVRDMGQMALKLP